MRDAYKEPSRGLTRGVLSYAAGMLLVLLCPTTYRLLAQSPTPPAPVPVEELTFTPTFPSQASGQLQPGVTYTWVAPSGSLKPPISSIPGCADGAFNLDLCLGIKPLPPIPSGGTYQYYPPYFPNAIIRQNTTTFTYDNGASSIDGGYVGGTFEPGAVATYLTAHGLPASDASYVYQYGRQDLRDEIRGQMLTQLFHAINSKSRTDEENQIVHWMEGVITAREIQLYTVANEQYQSFQKDACDFQTDSDVTKELGVSYDFSSYCAHSLTTFFSSPPIPTLDYYVGVGKKSAYQAPLGAAGTLSLIRAQEGLVRSTLLTAQDPNSSETAQAALVAGAAAGVPAALVSTNLAEIYPLRFGAARAAWIASRYFPTKAEALFHEALRAGQSIESAVSAADNADLIEKPVQTAITVAAEDATAATAEAASSAVGVVGIVLVAIEAAVEAGINAVQATKDADADATIPGTLAQVSAYGYKPDLVQMANDSDGYLKLCEAFIQTTYPDMPSTEQLPSPTSRQGFLAKSSDGTVQPLDSLQYQGSDGNAWTAQLWNGWLLQTAQVNGVQQSSFGLDIRYHDPFSDGDKLATRVAPNFWEVENLILDTNAPFCPLDGTLGVTDPFAYPVYTTCSSAVVAPLYVLAPGVQRGGAASLVYINQAPVITSPSTIKAVVKAPFTFQASYTTADPLGNIPCTPTSTAGNFGNVNFDSSTNRYTGVAPYFYPDTSPVAYTYSVQCGQFKSTQYGTFMATSTVAVIPPPVLNVTPGVPFTATVHTISYPTATLSLTYGPLPAGLQFKDNGDGTGTIYGITYVTSFSCSLSTCPNVVASNPSATQQALLNFKILYNPLAFTKPQPGATVSVSNDQTSQIVPVATTNIVGTTLKATFTGNQQSQVSFKDNGDGTGQFTYLDSYNAPAESIAATVTATPSNGQPAVVSNFTIAGTPPPPPTAYVSNGPLSFVVGVPDLSVSHPKTLTTKNNNPSPIQQAGPLPPGLSVYQNQGLTGFTPGSIGFSGVPSTGAGGLYHVPFLVGGALQQVDVAVYEAPSFPLYTGANTVYFHLGNPGTYNIHPIAGFPIRPFASLALGIGSSAGVSYSLDPSLTGGLTGTPFSVAAGSNGVLDGSLTLFYNGGALSSGSTFTLPLLTQVTTGPVGALNNGSYQNALYTASGTVPVNILIAPPGDANLDGKVDCTDFALVRAAIGQHKGSSNYSSLVDLNNDGVIDARDLIIVTRHTQVGMCH